MVSSISSGIGRLPTELLNAYRLGTTSPPDVELKMDLKFCRRIFEPTTPVKFKSSVRSLLKLNNKSKLYSLNFRSVRV